MGYAGWRASLATRRQRLSDRMVRVRERAMRAYAANFPEVAAGHVPGAGAAAAAAAGGAAPSHAAPPSPPALFAVVSLGGKQYKVCAGDVIHAEKLRHTPVATELRVSPHVVGSPTTTLLGRPTVQGATVVLRVESHELDRKLIVFKKKRRKRYQRTQGHRREVSRVRVAEIICDVGAY
jgi:large subunit ribosomal protein L21